MNNDEKLNNKPTDEEIFNDVIQIISPFLIENNYFNVNDEELKNEIFLTVIESNQSLYLTNKDQYIKQIKKDILSKYNNTSDVILTDSIKIYLKDIGKFSLLSKEEEERLFKEYKEGNIERKKEIIEKNLKLVVSVAKSYYKSSLPFLDLIQEGNIGLMIAVDKFDPSLGNRFSTYAVWWIRHTILKAIAEKEKMIRIPSGIYTQLVKIKKKEKEFYIKNGREPSVNELAEALDMNEKEIKSVMDFNYEYTSINQKINVEDDVEYGDTISSEHVIEDDIILSSLNNEIYKYFKAANLTKDQIVVMIYIFGLNGEAPYTIEKVAKLVKKTKESVRQIQKKALLKLKNCPFKNEIINYYDEKYDLSNNDKKEKNKKLI